MTDDTFEDLNLRCPGTGPTNEIIPDGDLELLAYVDPSRIPLRIIVGLGLLVTTGDDRTEEWFSDVLLHESPLQRPGVPDAEEEEEDFQQVPWHESGADQSRIAILARPSQLSSNEQQNIPKVTEILFYAARKQAQNPAETLAVSPTHAITDPDLDGVPLNAADPAVDIELRAILLSSDLLNLPLEPTHASPELEPLSPDPLPSAPDPDPDPDPTDQANKTRLNTLFDTATSRRKRTRHNNAHSIPIAASKTAGAAPPTPSLRALDARLIKIEDSLLHDDAIDSPKEAWTLEPRRPKRRLSRSSSVSLNSRPGSVRGAPAEFKRSSLSQVANGAPAGTETEDGSIEARNKQTVSRVVMAGMRIYGMQQCKGCDGVGANDGGGGNAEYKNVYHQVYKGALFAFRRDVGSVLLGPEAIRDVVDRLLGIFCDEAL